MRCVAHIINLIVQGGVKDAFISVDRVRGAVRYIRASPSRLSKFSHQTEEEMVGTKAYLCLDVPTRWNSTYMMLNVAKKNECVFEAYVHDDHNFFLDLSAGYGALTYVYSLLDGWKHCGDLDIMSMASKMNDKYKKYWGDSKVMNLLIYLAVIFDPLCKIDFLAFGVNLLFPTIVDDIIRMVNRELHYLFVEYSAIVEGNHHVNVEVECNFPTRAPSSSENKIDQVKRKIGLVTQQYIKKKQRVGLESKSNLDRYLGEDCENNLDSFNLLLWWKVNSPRFPIVAQMARDVLSVPISTVASESTFSTSGRVLDDFKSSLTPFMVEALVCTQDWLRSSKGPINLEEYMEELQNIDDAIGKMSWVSDDRASIELELNGEARVSSDISEDANEDDDDDDDDDDSHFQRSEPEEARRRAKEVNGEGIGDETDFIVSDDVVAMI
ncbi:zinc finger BED domain-containing protein RICESLEEPER 2-like [Gossypium hirsutum]|uniref:Zinc finger BED domain-containing protein RICESLEEPER 2-like n=1 Tax=Gossypium hirsutum TaxID=3635 RepID=A0A1U8IY29_GOSHI|nr:zinc finger BED domain-containing protein RICESLEEPER 2-like [Gossypium hirsutum]